MTTLFMPRNKKASIGWYVFALSDLVWLDISVEFTFSTRRGVEGAPHKNNHP